MLFRSFDGKIIEINRKDFKSDDLYYEYVIKMKYNISFPKSGNMKSEILGMIK